MNIRFSSLLILSIIYTTDSVDKPVNFEPYVFRYDKDDRFFYFPGDGDNQIYLVDTLNIVMLSLDDESVYRADVEHQNTYWLYTRKNMNESQELKINEKDSVLSSNFNVLKNTVFIVHGWKGNCKNILCDLLTTAFLEDGDVNVIVVDYSRTADQLYIMAIEDASRVGRHMGQFISWLNTLGMSYHTTHLVGFSLGAHIVGIAGRFNNGTVRRITALDPAGPLWYDNDDRLKSTDAQYVEVIHTNMLLYGYDGKLGDADFYPNGGIFMPECNINACSHSMSYFYMAKSVQFNNFIAYECEYVNDLSVDLCSGSDYPMGNSDLKKNRTGIFRLDTV